MSMFIGKFEVISLARDVYVGKDFKGALRRVNKKFVEDTEKKLWETLNERYPERDFTGGDESLAHANLVIKIKPLLKCKFLN